MLEFLIEFVVEVLGEILFAIAGAALAEAISDHRQANPRLAAIGHALMGAIAGGISLLVLRRQLIAQPPLPGVSLVLAPLCTGAVLNLLGDWSERRGNVRMALFTFWGGFWFALAMAIVRFLYFAW